MRNKYPTWIVFTVTTIKGGKIIMAKTLVVKLAGTVDNPDLRKLGEIRIQITPYVFDSYELNPKHQLLALDVSEPIQLELTGDGHFTDDTLTQNLGTTITLQAGYNNVYVSDSTSTLHIYNKYAITQFLLSMWDNKYTHHHWLSNLADFEGMYALTNFDVHYCNVTADSSLVSFRDLTNLTSLKMISFASKVKGDLSDIAGLTKLTNLNLFSQNAVTGNISSIAGLTLVTYADLRNCSKLTGNTSSIAHLHPNNGGKLATLVYSGTQVTGDWPPSA